jgi:preprotein translocase subunit SecD
VPVSFTPKEMSVFYPTVDLFEFIAIPITNNVEFLEATKKLKFEDTDLSIFRKLAKVLQRILNTIAGVDNKVGNELMAMSMDFLKKRANTLGTMEQNISAEAMNEIQNNLPSVKTEMEVDAESLLKDYVLPTGKIYSQEELNDLPDCIS